MFILQMSLLISMMALLSSALNSLDVGYIQKCAITFVFLLFVFLYISFLAIFGTLLGLPIWR